MKPTARTAYIILILTSVLLSGECTNAQLSKKLLHYLPDSCLPRPLNKCKLEAIEISSIYRYAKAYVDPKMNTELDSLGAVWTKQNFSEKNDSLYIVSLSQLISFSLNSNNFDASVKYCDALLLRVQGRKEYNTTKYSYEKIRGALYASAGLYEESIRYFNNCLNSAKSENDSIGIAEIYSGLSYPYAILGLYEQSIASLDSSFSYFGNIKNEYQPFYVEQQDVLVSKCGRLLNMYEKTGNSTYGEKAEALIKAAVMKKNHHYLYDIFPIGKAYLDGKYKRTLFLCDSMLARISKSAPAHKEALTGYINKYKGQILLMTERNAEGEQLIKQLIAFYFHKKGASGNANANIIRLSEKLYTYYKTMHQWAAAYEYLEMHKKYSDSLGLLENRGKIFELEQKYNFAKKEVQLKVLENTNTVNRKKITLAISGGVISLLCMLVIALLLYNRNRKLALKKKLVEKESEIKINKLRFVSQLHIAELEDRHENSKREEQKKMGMELHDVVGANLACILMRLRTLTTRITDRHYHEDVEQLVILTAGVYETVREKSHHWFNMATDSSDFSFAASIQQLLETCLPGNIYEKEILVDNDSLNKTSMPVKIELMHIIREAIANIIKHANAKKIAILIYEDLPGLVICVSDNGGGFNTLSCNEGMGLKSIKNRALAIGGKADITSGKAGTEIKVTLPL